MDTKRLRQRVLDLAIHGKLVPQNPQDEPASELLKRITKEKEKLVIEGKIKKSQKKDNKDIDEVPFEVPQGWVWTTINDICSKIGSGSTPRGSNYSQEGIPFFRSQNVYNDGLKYDDIKYISEDTHKSMIGTEVHSMDILLNITGGSLGRCALVPEDFNRGNVSQHVCILRPVLLFPKYLHGFIISDYFASRMILSGSGREGLPKYSLEAMRIPLPPLAEQYRIVSEVEKYFSLIDILEESENDLQQSIQKAKSKILDLAIKGKLVEQNEEDESASVLLERIKEEKNQLIKEKKIKKEKALAEITEEEKFFEIPKNWIWCRWGDLSFSIQYGYNAPAQDSGDIRMVRISDIQNNEVLWDTVPFCDIKKDEIDGYLLQPNDILFARTGGTVGKSFLVDSVPYPSIYAGYLIRTRYSHDLVPKYLKYFMESHLYWEQLRDGTIATAQPNCNGKTLGNMILPLPPLAEQHRIVEKVETIFTQLDNIAEALK